MFAFPWGELCRRGRVRAPAVGLYLALLLAAGLCGTTRVRAEEAAAREIWSGADNAGSIWAFYSGLTVAPGDITQPGPRLRLLAGMSTYADAGRTGPARAAQPFADLLAGYQWQRGALTLKAFAGATGHADIRTPEQVRDLWGQARVGAKLVGEGWWTIDPTSWASLDVAVASPQATLWSRMRIGYRVQPQLSLGPEAGLVGDIGRPGGRLGLFARLDGSAGEVAVAGGVAGAAGTPSAGPSVAQAARATSYLTLTWLQRF